MRHTECKKAVEKVSEYASPLVNREKGGAPTPTRDTLRTERSGYDPPWQTRSIRLPATVGEKLIRSTLGAT